jgi:hypothetical protein
MSTLVMGCNSTLGYHLLNLLPHHKGEIAAFSAELPPENMRLPHVNYAVHDLLESCASETRFVATCPMRLTPVSVSMLL